MTRGQTALEDDWSATTTIRDKQAPEIVQRRRRGQIGGDARGQEQRVKRQEAERGQDDEKCWFEGVEEEKWVGQSFTLPEAKQRRREELPFLLFS